MRTMELKIRRFINKIDPTIRVVFHDGAMESASLEKTIFVNIDEFLYIFDNECEHLQVLREKGMLIDILLPVYILLHEVGHIKTIKKYVSPRGMLRQYKEKSKIVSKYKGIERLRMYKKIHLEKDADEYAYNFYIHNYDFVKQFDNEIRAML